MVPCIGVGDHVLVARVRQPGITPKLINTWTRPWRAVSKTGGNVYDVEDTCTMWRTRVRCGGHVYDVEDIVMERAREVQITRMRPYAHTSLNFAAELRRYSIALRARVGLTWRGSKRCV